MRELKKIKQNFGLLMDQFADTVIRNNSHGTEEVATAYFQFWEQYIDILLLLKKAHLPLEKLGKLYEKHHYKFSIKLAGFWKATVIWCEENPRKTPEEIAKLIAELFS